MKKGILFLMVVLLVGLIGCSANQYTQLERDNDVAVDYPQKNFLLGSEYFVSTGGATPNDKDGTVQIKSTEGKVDSVSYAFPFKSADGWNIKIKYNGVGRATVLFTESSDEQKINGVTLFLMSENEISELPLAQVNRFNRNGQVKINVSTADGEGVIIRSIEIEPLTSKPVVKVVHENNFPLGYRYTSWHHYYDGPIYYYDPICGCFRCYIGWRSYPSYSVWCGSVSYVYYHYRNSAYTYCQPNRVYYSKSYSRYYGGGDKNYPQRKQRQANSSVVNRNRVQNNGSASYQHALSLKSRQDQGVLSRIGGAVNNFRQRIANSGTPRRQTSQSSTTYSRPVVSTNSAQSIINNTKSRIVERAKASGAVQQAQPDRRETTRSQPAPQPQQNSSSSSDEEEKNKRQASSKVRR